MNKNLSQILGSKMHRISDPEHWDLDLTFLNVSKIAKREEEIYYNTIFSWLGTSAQNFVLHSTKCRESGLFYLPELTVCSGSFIVMRKS
jgi:hypothetical protein